MRKSNKILIGIFLSFVLLILAVHFTLYAKYSSGDFTSKKIEREDHSKTQVFAGVTNLTVSSLENLEIRFADTLKVETDKNTSPALKISAANGTLVITGADTSGAAREDQSRKRTFDRVVVYLPASVAAEIKFSEAQVFGYNDSTKRDSRSFTLVETRMNLTSHRGETSDYAGTLNITASSKSEVNIFNMIVDDLKVSLNNSAFSDNGFETRSISIQTDEASRLNLSGANLRKLKP